MLAEQETLFIVLAAGKGTRMVSARPKVLHAIANRTLLAHVLAVTQASQPSRVSVVVGPGMEAVAAEAKVSVPNAEIFVQQNQLGTGDAVKCARPALADHTGDVVVLYGDTPLLEAGTLRQLLDGLGPGPCISVLGFEASDPDGYGRLLLDPDGKLLAIREHKDATPAERAITLCNSGVFAFRVSNLVALLDRIGNSNAKGEFYLTDVVEIARGEGIATGVVVCCEEEVSGINTREQLAQCEAIFQRHARRRIMSAGATLISPDSVWFSADTKVGRDVLIEPNVVFGPNVTIEDGATILAHCHIDGAVVRKGARIGPFARLRPGARIGEDAHIGNFVEVKNVDVGLGAKANHLAYLGDGIVGSGANIGAGTIFCNYDGFFKHTTEVGAGAFVGSNSSLVAPVKIGDGAYVGSGSVITKDVTADALALERSSQSEHAGWAAKFRALMSKRKARSA